MSLVPRGTGRGKRTQFLMVHTNFRTLSIPYSSYSVLVKMAVPRAKIRTPGVRYSSYSVLPVLGAENNDRAAY